MAFPFGGVVNWRTATDGGAGNPPPHGQVRDLAR
jgi:hypothetical protein